MNVSVVIDVGTSSVRGVLFSDKGDVLLNEQKNTPPEFLVGGRD